MVRFAKLVRVTFVALAIATSTGCAARTAVPPASAPENRALERSGETARALVASRLPTVGVTTQAGTATAVCVDQNDILPAHRDELVSFARQVLRWARDERSDLIYEHGAPELHEAGTAGLVLEWAAHIDAVVKHDAALKLHTVRELTIAGAYIGLADCGSSQLDGDEDIVVSLTSGERDHLAIVTFDVPIPAVPKSVAVVMSRAATDRTGTSLQVVGVGINTNQSRGRRSGHYLRVSKSHDYETEPLTNVAALMMAERLGAITNAQRFAPSHHAQRALGELPADWLANVLAHSSEDLHVLDMRLVDMLSPALGPSLLVQYLTNGVLSADAVQREIDPIMSRIRSRNPHLAEAIPGIVFEAFEEIPISPHRAYPSYREVRELEP